MPWLTTAIAATRTLSTGAVATLAAGLVGIIVWVGVTLRYEGINAPWPVSIVWDGIPGRLDKAVAAARAQCEAEKERSRIEAAERDAEIAMRAQAEMESRVLMAQIERDAAKSALERFKREAADDDAEEESARPAGAACPPRYIVGPRASRGLQRRWLPYPDSLTPPDQ